MLEGLPGVELSDMLPKLDTQLISSSRRNMRRRLQRLRTRDREVGERGTKRRERLTQKRMDPQRKRLVYTKAGRRWAALEPLRGDEPDVGSFHVLEGEETFLSGSVPVELFESSEDEDFGFEPSPLAMAGLQLSGEPLRLLADCFKDVPEDGEADGRPCDDDDVFDFVRSNGLIGCEIIAA